MHFSLLFLSTRFLHVIMELAVIPIFQQTFITDRVNGGAEAANHRPPMHRTGAARELISHPYSVTSYFGAYVFAPLTESI